MGLEIIIDIEAYCNNVGPAIQWKLTFSMLNRWELEPSHIYNPCKHIYIILKVKNDKFSYLAYVPRPWQNMYLYLQFKSTSYLIKPHSRISNADDTSI